jgi:1,5-anhydro-D-fructose reductase (1,5-anhydro-D-mannitol-forming)
MIPAMREIGDTPVGVISSNAQRGAEYAAQHGLEASGTQLSEISDWDVQAVYISTTNQLHAQQAIECAQAGLHVLCEKPLAMSVEDARRTIEECSKFNVVLATNHHLRNKGTIRTIRNLIEEGEIGEVLAIRMHHAVSLPERLRGWRLTDTDAGAGVILDITVHDADTVRFITGSEVVRVSAVTATQGLGQEGIEDSAVVTMTLESGALVLAHESFVVPHAGMGIEVHGSLGSIFAAGALNQESSGEVLIRRFDEVSAVPVEDRTDVYVVGLRAFDAAVAGGSAPLATGLDGLMSMAVALAALKSSAEHREVTLDEILEGATA